MSDLYVIKVGDKYIKELLWCCQEYEMGNIYQSKPYYNYSQAYIAVKTLKEINPFIECEILDISNAVDTDKETVPKLKQLLLEALTVNNSVTDENIEKLSRICDEFLQEKINE